jgi:hypothetical protein
VAKLDGDKRLVMLIDPSRLLGAREAGMRGRRGRAAGAGDDGTPARLARAA